jgi:hypothetical protein
VKSETFWSYTKVVGWRTANTFAFFFDEMPGSGYIKPFTGKRTMRDVTSAGNGRTYGTSINFGMIVMVSASLVLTGGCHRDRGAAVVANLDHGIVPSDPQVQSNLDTLTGEVHRALVTPQYRLTGGFDQFVAATGVDVPPPPAGEKYALNKEWQVILVDAKAK